MQPYIDTSISIGSLKSAALYFDYLIPVNLGAEFTEHGSFEGFPTELGALLRSLRELIPPRFRDNEAFARELALVNKDTAELMLSASRQSAKSDALHKLKAMTTREAIYRFIDNFALNAAMLDCRASLFDPAGSADASPTLLVSLNLIDVEKVQWDTIIELRKDLEAQERLRRLRLFVYENYAGKSKAYIEDDILNRISEYEREARHWGLEMTDCTLNTMLGSKLLVGSMAGSLLSVLAGAPTAAVLGSAGVGALELGRITIKVVKRRAELVDSERRNPVSYISYAKRQLAKKPGHGHVHRHPHRQPW